MGRRPRSKQDVENRRSEILEKALEVIEKEGFDGFSIRKLGPMLGVAPKTIYNYFQNKDEIYLHVLTRGFILLYDELIRATHGVDNPCEKLSVLTKTYVKFGFERSNYYDIMLTLYVPKANDYIGTPLEELADKELETAMRAVDLFRQAFDEIFAEKNKPEYNDTTILFMQLLTGMHGIVALRNNTIFDYLHEDPDSIIDLLIEGVLKPFQVC